MNTKQQLLQNPLVKEIAKDYSAYVLKGIMEFKDPKNGSYFDDFVKSNEPVREWEILEYLLEHSQLIGHYCAGKIKSVKRLSDGIVFSVGDITHAGEITSFEIQGQNMIAKGSYFEYHINHLEKVKRKHIFITDDNVKIYEGDEYFFCGEPLIVYSSKAVWYDIDGALQNTGNKHFSTREKAEEYCTMNRQCLSVNDVLSFTFSESVHVKRLQEQLLELAKAKQNMS